MLIIFLKLLSLKFFNTLIMLHWKAIYFILALVFGVIGFIGIGDGGLEPAKYISFSFCFLLIVLYALERKSEKD